jgi:DNA-binding transcriptional MerR regulator
MTIKETAKLLDIKEHVLRYWEEELNLSISRNDMGYREYSDRDIEMFRKIAALRKQGVGLKEIHDGINKARPDESNNTNESNTELNELNELKIVDFQAAQLQSVMNKIVANAFRENRHIITSSLRGELTEDVMKQIDVIMREQEERDEARFRKLDETIRQLQSARSEVAATRAKRHLFRR